MLLLFPFLCQANDIDCKNIREGLFTLESEDGSLHTIVRTKDKQTENVGKTGLVSEYDIKWTSECSYILFNRKVVKGTDNMPTDFKIDTFYNEIVEVNGDYHKIVSSIKGYDMKIEVVLVKLDTNKLHRDLSEIQEFKNYNGTSYGGTLINDKLSIAYRQNNNDESDFLIAFQEVMSINYQSKYRLIEHLFIKIEPNQHLTTSNCRFNDKYDKEIAAIYISKNDDEDAKIFKAWRFNRQTLKIEDVDVSKVKYKVADKNLFNWDN